ncbi:MAG: GspH/FimT family pseudopilin [Gammaproteobacteria bacterium]|nr:GspH/FimT family pseudopilin [Gammaproteobacteria bacterium]
MNRNSGFTLVELIVTLAIAAIVVTVGVPSFQAMMRNNRAATHTNEFMSALNLARSEAVKRGWRVVLCPSTNQTNCTGTPWENGWIVFVDADANGNGALDEGTDNNGVLDAGELLLRAYDPLGGNDTLTGNGTLNVSISFAADGSTRIPGGNAFQAGTLNFSLCYSNNRQNSITINNIGRARTNDNQGAPPVPCTQ